jgi:hypothetical protein
MFSFGGYLDGAPDGSAALRKQIRNELKLGRIGAISCGEMERGRR